MRKKSIVGFAVVVVSVLLVLGIFWLRGTENMAPPVSTVQEDTVARPTIQSTPNAPESEEQVAVVPAAVSTPEPPRTLGAGTLHAVVTDRVGEPAARALLRLEIRKGYDGEAEGFPIESRADGDGEVHFTELPSGH
ncbi:MAG: hypothetical protein L3K26_19810, partial [Candidatus Hydrogenedentes bacterium]|nr:hypothetical protein [Candidatus Hydrogenedentota bacterium]